MHTNQILRTNIKTGSTYLKFGLVKVGHCVCVCVCMESCLGMDFKRANELLKEQWSCDSFEEGKAQG